LALAAVLGAAGLAAAQRTGSVQGLVVDEQAQPLEGVRITVSSSALPDEIEGRTAADGSFTIELPDVTLAYELRFELDGYQGVVHELDARHMQHAALEVRLPKVAPAAGKKAADSGAEAEPPGEQRHAAVSLFNEGVEALQADDLDTANARFLAAMETDPSFPEPYRALAATAGETEDWAAAARWAEKLLEFEPDNSQAMSTVYFGHLMTGNVDAAKGAAERLAAADPDALAQILDHGKTFFANNDFAMARALLEVYTTADPSQPDPYFPLGVSCNALGDTDAARTAFARFLELAPPDHGDRGAAEEMLEFLH
jgi:Flp pilus assembly protein TadD